MKFAHRKAIMQIASKMCGGLSEFWCGKCGHDVSIHDDNCENCGHPTGLMSPLEKARARKRERSKVQP